MCVGCAHPCVCAFVSFFIRLHAWAAGLGSKGAHLSVRVVEKHLCDAAGHEEGRGAGRLEPLHEVARRGRHHACRGEPLAKQRQPEEDRGAEAA